jgi:hypothetical protein
MGAFARSSLQSPERCQRARPARREAAEKAAALSPRRARARRGSRSARSRRRAVKHGAVGGRMTARWSGVFRGERRRRCAPWRISKQNAGGFSHGARRAVSEEGVFATGARERNVGCRSGFKAPRRCVQGKPQGPTRSTSPSDRKAKRPGRGPMSFTSRKGATARGSRKADTSPRSWRPSNLLVPWSSLGSRSPGCGLSPWKARGASSPAGAKHACWRARSRLCGQGRQCGDWRTKPAE